MSRRPPRPNPPLPDPHASGAGERLQKVLAAAGIGSRRECEELIATGRVEVDRVTVTELGTRVDPLRHEIRVDGVALPRPKRAYYVLNKPAGVVCTNRDPSGRVRAVDLVRSDERLFTVGRLDRTSEGLILVTNDGELANRLTHPRYGVEKRYLVRVVGHLDPSLCERLRRGIHLAEGVARLSDIRVRKRTARFTDLEISLREGKNREIRRLLARVGHKVVHLKRIGIGPLRLGMLPPGATRPLTRDEVRQLQEESGQRDRGKARKARRRPTAHASASPAESAHAGTSQGKPRRDKQHDKSAGGKAAGGKSVPDRSVRDVSPSGKHRRMEPTPVEFVAPEPDDVEVTDYEMDHPTGSVLPFDDGSPGTPAPFTKKRR